MKLTLPAPAKLNLGLRILGRRPDGYHDIRSLFRTVSLRDSVTLDVTAGGGGVIELQCGVRGIPEDGSNLAWKAVQIFSEETGLELSASITIEKRIPARAGLGGGSSDGASALLALKRITGLDIDLHPLAMRLGSDVPFFLLPGGAAVVGGRGEDLRPVHPPDFHAVLLHPAVEVPTAWAYEAWDRDFGGSSLTDKGIRSHCSASSAAWHEGKPFPQDLWNDFLPLLEKRFPEIERLTGYLRDSGVVWGLSGSGPTLYALFRKESEASRFSEELPGGTDFSICSSAEAAGASSNW